MRRYVMSPSDLWRQVFLNDGVPWRGDDTRDLKGAIENGRAIEEIAWSMQRPPRELLEAASKLGRKFRSVRE